MSVTVREQDITQSVADALQFISCYHPVDFVQAIHKAYLKEESKAAKDAMAQILINSRMCAMGRRPICQDTGIVTIFVKVGMNVRLDIERPLEDVINEGVRQAYTNPDNILRASVLKDPAGVRKNTRDNTPAVIHMSLVPGNTMEFQVAAKGGGSENKSKLAMLNPSDDIVEWVKKTVPTMGAGWCPPGMLGIGIGGTAEKAMLMAKEALMDPVDIHVLREKGPENRVEELRLELMEAVNNLGIGAQGLGGLTTVLDVKIKDYPTHAASLPVALIPNCAATRHAHFTLKGEGPVFQKVPDLNEYPEIALDMGEDVRKINVDDLSPEEMKTWKPGDTVLLSGKILTGRDAAHKRLVDMIEKGEELPVDLKGRFIYYVGPVDPVGDEVVGPAGPTTATRMDKFTRTLLEQTGLAGMIGKAERGTQAIDAIRDNESVYLIAVGGAAYLVSQAVKKAEVLAFPELGMEAIYEFEVEDMPVTVAVDSCGGSVHISGPKIWQQKIEAQKLEIK